MTVDPVFRAAGDILVWFRNWALRSHPLATDWTVLTMTGPPNGWMPGYGTTSHTDTEPPEICPWFCPDEAGRCFYCLETEDEHTPRALGK